MNFAPVHPALFIVLVFAWFAVLIGASVVYRSRKGAFFPAPLPDGVRFDERWTSGRSLRNLVTRSGGASRCLRVSVTDDEIWIRLEPPLQFGFMPEILDLEHRIEASQAPSTRLLKGLIPLSRDRVRLDYCDSDGRSRAFELLLRDPEAFMAAAQEIAPNATQTAVSPGH
ncbi:MAG TPA: hypothetical protein VFJ58_27050 [Armatimonadota bacterium]|nr:hypothetical protein [Armatimonadota bacterium]